MAGYFVSRAERLERRYGAASFNANLDTLIAGYAASSLFTTVAFLEALINELFADAAQKNGGNLSSIDPGSLALIADLGESTSVQKSTVTEKFGILLRAAQKEPISKSCNPGQDLATAIRLRNELVHYKAEFFDVGTPGAARVGNFLESKLPHQISGRFQPRPGSAGMRADGWLGAGCASWALKHAISYADEVFLRLGIKPIYDHVRQTLPPSVR
ncbi:hypothetical protein [Pseudomonas sp. KB-10]|uniref:hypothetical protein n=1 Tax=Pseudomonas sp. KB-10 TaxID=2292264 RepID=UPI001BB039A1|nr:hypothetical protein [Pseudomonas sp. KB-10]